MNRTKIGSEAEEIAVRYLKGKKGYRILARNFRYGRKELDIVARDGDTVVFVEVKMRNSTRFGFPEESVNGRKMNRISLVARHFLRSMYRESYEGCRFDVVSILRTQKGLKLVHLENAFDDRPL